MTRLPLHLPKAMTVALTNSLGSWTGSEWMDIYGLNSQIQVDAMLLMYEGTSTLCHPNSRIASWVVLTAMHIIYSKMLHPHI